MKNLSLFLVCLFVSATITAKDIDLNTAKQVAKNFYFERIQSTQPTDFADISVADVIELKLWDRVMLYAVNLSSGGYVIVCADDRLRPVAGYALKGVFTGVGLPPQMDELVHKYKLQVNEAIENSVVADPWVKAEWNRLRSGNPETLVSLKYEKEAEPMLTTTWDQGRYYNEMCPPDPAGPGGHCYAGCVATALGQVVNYFRWPETGTGSYTYDCPPYGTLTANYGETTYEWDKMATNLDKSNLPLALLLNHLGIGCDMVYGPNGSGMYNHKAAYVLRTFFKYSPETVYVYRDSTSMDWDSLLVSHLDQGIPMYYAGWSVPNINGHAFVCDGYQSGDYYHFNWGWSGAYDGYFYTSNLNPGGSNFNLAQEVIINAFPDTVAYDYPYYCQGDKTMDIIDGTIDDGSGPLYDYAPDMDCSWLIAPSDTISSITISFLEFNTASGDILTVYDGETTAAPVLGIFQGPDMPTDITSTGDRVLITFETNSDTEAPGWLLEYRGEIPIYCQSMNILDEQSGNISDGSGPRDYFNNTSCIWMISPPGAGELTVYFSDFNTEAEFDYVKIYDLATQEVLADYSGNISPDPVTSTSGKMSIRFNTNGSITAAGWDAYYETDLVSIAENIVNKSLDIYPNPARDKTRLLFSSNTEQPVSIRLRNIGGQLVAVKEMHASSGKNTIDIDLNGVESGLYLLSVEHRDGIEYRKLIIE
ncbi:MAG: C10 family peptidase [Bacteroidales bacterium]|jgi:hypothetical protein|nr:C10 family peptidase [Bacteroidales bacterium]